MSRKHPARYVIAELRAQLGKHGTPRIVDEGDCFFDGGGGDGLDVPGWRIRESRHGVG